MKISKHHRNAISQSDDVPLPFVQVSTLIDELTIIEDVLFAGHTGVVVKLTQAAVSCPESQPALLESLMKAFHTEHDPQHCAPVFLSLMTHDMVFGGDEAKLEVCS